MILKINQKKIELSNDFIEKSELILNLRDHSENADELEFDLPKDLEDKFFSFYKTFYNGGIIELKNLPDLFFFSEYIGNETTYNICCDFLFKMINE